jgi:hypothetical protein
LFLDVADQQDALSYSALNKDTNVQLNCLIENGMTELLDIGDLCLTMRLSPNDFRYIYFCVVLILLQQRITSKIG